VANYDLRVRPFCMEDVEKIPKKDLKKILVRMESLRDESRPPGRVQAFRTRVLPRIRQGDYRSL